MTPETPFWDALREADLVRLWTEGKSQTAIAKLLGEPCTSSMVAGKVRRLGLNGRKVVETRPSGWQRKKTRAKSRLKRVTPPQYRAGLPEETLQAIRRMWLDKASRDAIAAALGMSAWKVECELDVLRDSAAPFDPDVEAAFVARLRESGGMPRLSERVGRAGHPVVCLPVVWSVAA